MAKLIKALLSLMTLAPVASAAERGGSTDPSWQPGHLLPTFAAPAQELMVLDIWRADDPTVVLATSLQGLVNRRQPRIWLHYERWRADVDWLEDFCRLYGVTSRPVEDLPALLAEFREEIHGAILYDPDFPHSLNYAATLGSWQGCVVAHPRDVEMLKRLDIDVTRDLRDGAWDHPAAMYLDAWLQMGGDCENRLLGGQPLSDRDRPEEHQSVSAYDRDYHMAGGAFCFDLDPFASVENYRVVNEIVEGAAELAVFNSFGFGGEASTVSYCSGRDCIVACGYPGNASVLSAKPPRIPELPRPSVDLRQITRTDAAFLNLVWSDGDNPRYCYTALRYAVFANRTRVPEIPLTFTISPLLADVGPTMLDHYSRAAGAVDSFMGGLSGVAYSHPWKFTPSALDRYIEATRLYLDLCGLRTIQVQDRTGRMPAPWMERLVREVRPFGLQVLGGGFPAGRAYYFAGSPIPVCTSHGGGWVPPEGLRATAVWLREQPRPLFITTGINCWQASGIYDVLADESVWQGVEIISAEAFFAAQHPEFLRHAWTDLNRQARGQLPRGRLTGARSLNREAETLMKKGDYESACVRWRRALRALIETADEAGVALETRFSI